METYLVTGGAGFIGSNIAERLLAGGHKVRVVDNFSTGRRQNITGFLGNQNFSLLEGDITDAAVAREATAGVDYVLHQAAINSVPRSIDDPVTSHQANTLGTLNLLMAAKEAGVKKFVYASSSSVYGDNPQLPKKEDFPIQPISPYALTKYVGERYCQIYARLHGVPAVCLRYFNVFGPRQNPESQYAAALPKFIAAALANQPVTVFGDGKQGRDFTYVENVVNANLLAAQSGPATHGQVYNIACSEEISLNGIIAMLKEISGNDFPVEYQSPRKGDVLHSLADISKAKADLGYSPTVGFAEGLKKSVECIKSC